MTKIFDVGQLIRDNYDDKSLGIILNVLKEKYIYVYWIKNIAYHKFSNHIRSELRLLS